MREARRHLRLFESELADANRRLSVSLEVGSLVRFADLFLDGIIADWFVQSKISKARSTCSSTMAEVDKAIEACKSELRNAQRERDDLQEQLEELVVRTDVGETK